MTSRSLASLFVRLIEAGAYRKVVGREYQFPQRRDPIDRRTHG